MVAALAAALAALAAAAVLWLRLRALSRALRSLEEGLAGRLEPLASAAEDARRRAMMLDADQRARHKRYESCIKGMTRRMDGMEERMGWNPRARAPRKEAAGNAKGKEK